MNINSAIRKKRFFLGELLILGAAILWASTFLFQKEATAFVEPGFFSSIRFLFGAAAMGITLLFRVMLQRVFATTQTAAPYESRKLWVWGSMAGFFLFAAGTMQQHSLQTASITSVGFITGLYVVAVPFIQAIYRWRMPKLGMWFIIGLVMLGLYLASGFYQDGLRAWYALDTILMFSPLMWAMHLLILDHGAKYIPTIPLHSVQVLLCAAFSLVYSLCFEWVNWPDNLAALRHKELIIALLYAGVVSSALAFGLQVAGQQYLSATMCALLMSLESLFGALFAFWFVGERVTMLEGVGYALMAIAVTLASIRPSTHEHNH